MFPFICADTEDNSKELLLRQRLGEKCSGFDKQLTQTAAIAADGRKFYARGKDGGKEFLRWFKLQPEPICYFHNSQYDLGNLFGKSLDELDVTMVGGRMIKAVWGEKTFLDTFNLLQMSVKKLAPAFGLQKLEYASSQGKILAAFEAGLITRAQAKQALGADLLRESQFMAQNRDYVFMDCEIIRQAMLFIWDLAMNVIGLERAPNTLGGFAVAVWKHWGGVNVHDSLDSSRNALFGGRVELFKEQNQSRIVAYCDINSLYPYIMRTRVFPHRLENFEQKLPPFGLADVTIEVPECDIAPLPFRKEDGRIYYPWGRFRGTWAMPELLNAQSNGSRIVKVHQAYGSEDSMTPYKDFVDRLYLARLRSKTEAEKLFYKLLMNNLYGRLCATGEITRSVWQTEKNRFDGVAYGEKVLVSYQLPLSEETNWSHAAYVTSHARVELFCYLKRVGAERLIYCDTDSVIFDLPDCLLCGDQGSLAIPPWYFSTGKELGEMKIEALGEFTVRTWAPKMYHAGKEWKAKGVPKAKAREFIEKGSASYDMPFRFREAAAFFDPIDKKGRKRPNNSKRLSVWRTVTKSKASDYDRKNLLNGRFYPRQLTAT